MRSQFDRQLALLNRELTRMGAMCEEAIALAAKAHLESSGQLAAQVGPVAEELGRLERDVETLCLRLILQQQPVARDLRQISAALKMITDMKRIGDQAEDIAEISVFLAGHSVQGGEAIHQMARATIQMVTDSIDAFVKQDVQLAENVVQQDDGVDEAFLRVKTDLIRMIAENPENGECTLDLLMIAKYFERIGDHAANIARWVIFAVTGEHEGEEA